MKSLIRSASYTALLYLIGVTAWADPLRIVIVGDSTVCDYGAEEPLGGWGQYIQPYFKESVVVLNRARGGRSTKTFIRENLWADALKDHPNVMLIQFGHNDAHESGPEFTDAAGEYGKNLRLMIDEARSSGATPILVTPMYKRKFEEDGTLKDGLRPYVEAMKRVAAKKRAFLVDLHKSSGLLFIKLGETRCRDLGIPTDDTHFNKVGAKKMAELVIQGLLSIEPRLSSHLSSPAPDGPQEGKEAPPKSHP